MKYRPKDLGSSWKEDKEKDSGKGFWKGVSFNMHSPGEEERAALSAGAPVWPLWQRDRRRPDSQTSFHRWCRPGAQRSASHWCCPWHWPRRTRNLEEKQSMREVAKLCSVCQATRDTPCYLPGRLHLVVRLQIIPVTHKVNTQRQITFYNNLT